MLSPTIVDVLQARRRIAGTARHTYLEHSRRLSQHFGCDVLLKLECLQATGSFKIRGAASKLWNLAQPDKTRGVLTVSAGNHGLAIAHCAEAFGLQATVVVPTSASRAKVHAIQMHPVLLREIGATYDEAERAARKMENESGLVFVSPYNDPEVIAGQGTVAVEILEQDTSVDAIVVPTGGGGLLAGVAIAAKALAPRVRIYGAEPAASPTMTKALEAGHILEIHEEETIADGCAGNIEAGSITFPIIEHLVDGMILVSETAMRQAVAQVARYHHLIIEGAAAVAVAALADTRLRECKAVAIVTGRNIDLDLFTRLVKEYSASESRESNKS